MLEDSIDSGTVCHIIAVAIRNAAGLIYCRAALVCTPRFVYS